MIDQSILDAIDAATRDVGQPPDVAKQLKSWLTAVAEGSESLGDPELVSRRCEFLYNSVVVEEEPND